ncbi:uncharacterized protein [Leptinotarsa decemlineata]|uniref:uncharacterized protein n=1 Tax=Leptinotarsa decemlineata TaxID=7539 RepID=UPI003D30A8CE
MYGKLRIKPKATSLIQPKTQVFKRKIKQERSSTPQRWSRRIRSLPPIPINVLKTRRRPRTKSLTENKLTLSKLVLKNKQKKLHSDGDKKSQRVLKNCTPHDSKSLEVLRIVPVVVYIRDKKAKFKSLSDDVEIQIKEKCNSQCFNKTLRENIFQQKLRKECCNLERKWSKRLKSLPFETLDM